MIWAAGKVAGSIAGGVPKFSKSPGRITFLFVFVILAGLACRCVAAQKNALPDFLLTSWDSEDGLPVETIRNIVRSPDGYLWIATSAGLARFDGARFVVFTTNNLPALGDNRPTCLAVDATGNLWVGTAGGTLARRQGGGFFPVELSPVIRGKPLNSMAADPTGAIWLASQGAGLVRLREGIGELFGVSDGLPASVVSQVVVTDGGQVFALAGGRLASFDGRRWKTQVVPVAQNSTIRVLAKGVGGGLWVATTFQTPDLAGAACTESAVKPISCHLIRRLVRT